MGFDAGYYIAGNNRKLDRKTCPNPLYVGATRAKNQLVLIHDSTKEYLPFILPDNVRKWATVYGEEKSVRAGSIPVTEIELRKALSFLAEEQIMDAITLLEFETIKPAGSCTRIAESAAQLFGDKKLSEDVSDINCIAVTSYVESGKTGEYPSTWIPDKNNITPTIPKKDTTISAEIVEQYLRISANYDARESGYKARVNQISDWGWITPSSFSKLATRLHSCLGDRNRGMKWALRHFRPVKVGGNTIKVYCTVPVEINNTVFDVRCFARISPAHKLRLACVAAIHSDKNTNYHLVNIRTGEEIKLLTRDSSLLYSVLDRVVNLRFANREEISDEQFRDHALAVRNAAVSIHVGESDEYSSDDGDGEPEGDFQI